MQDPRPDSTDDYAEDRYDNPATGIRARRWVLLLALTIFVGAAVYWAFTAEIPVTVQSQGILLHPTGASNIEANRSGVARRILVSRGEEVKKDAVLIELSMPDLQVEIDKVETSLLAKIKLNEKSAKLAQDRLANEKVLAAKQQASKLEAAETIQKLIESNLRISQDSLAGQEDEIAKITRRSEDLLSQLNEQRAKMQSAVDRQLATQADLTVLDSQLYETENGLSALENRKNSLKLEKLKTAQTLADLESRAAVIMLSMSEIENGLLRLEQSAAAEAFQRDSDIEATKEILENLRRRYDEVRFVKAPFTGTIIELPVGIGQAITAGEVVTTISKQPAAGEEEPLRVTAFFPISLGKQVSPNDVAFITPTTIQRERYGSIRGQVAHVYSLPVSAEEAIHAVGNREVLRPLFNRGGLLGIHVTVEHDANGNLSWTGKNSPPQPTAGTTVGIRIVVERRRPISYLLPFMNRAVFGTETDEASESGGK